MKTFLGVDGGGSKTDFLLIDEQGRVLASHRAGSAYYLEIGVDALQAMLAEGVLTSLRRAGLDPSSLEFAFIGLPSYGEDSDLLARMDGMLTGVLPAERYRCGNDMVCGWAGALASRDGINVVAGTGSIAYGELGTRQARAGGWGELFGDEGSAHWIVREALTLFARMSDGRAPKTGLHQLIGEHLQLRADLDLCAAVYGPPAMSRSELARLAPLVALAARSGDAAALDVFARAAQELVALVDAVYDQLCVPADLVLPVSCSGGMFWDAGPLRPMLEAALRGGDRRYEFVAPQLSPVAGAALYAAKLSGLELTAGMVGSLRSSGQGKLGD